MTKVEFYKAWIDDLDTLSYKWPVLSSGSESNKIIKNEIIVYQSVEQLHSTNAGVNEKSQRILEKESAKLDFNEIKCNIKFKRLNSCKFENNLLITKINNNEDLEFIDKTISLFFPYIIVCCNFENSFINISDMNNYFLTFVDESDFDKCVSKVKNIGFKQHTHFIIDNIRDFLFWTSIEIKKTARPDSYKNKQTFVRNNVANGFGSIINFNKNEMSMCDAFKTMGENNMCSNLYLAIDKLNWHSNNLVSERCADMEVKTIWLPDLHDGTRLDVASVLVHLGMKSLTKHFILNKSTYYKTLNFKRP